MDRYAISPRANRHPRYMHPYDQELIEQARQRADRHVDIYREHLVGDVPAHKMHDSKWGRVEELGGEQLKEAKHVWTLEMTDALLRADGPNDEIYQQAVMRATSKYNAVGRKYEQEECDERANVCSMADAVLADFKSAESDRPYMDEALEHLEFCAEKVCEQEIEEILNGPSYGPVR